MKKQSLYLECAAGISGDMTVAALLDAGADTQALQAALDSIPFAFKTQISRVKKNGIDCCDFAVILQEDNHDHDMEYLFGHEHGHGETEHEKHHEHSHEHSGHEHEHSHDHSHHHSHRNMSDITKIIQATQMTDSARALALSIFSIIAKAESKAHGIPVDQVHFHEVGAVDSIVDVIAMAVCFDSLAIHNVYVPYMFEGCGTIRCQHGILPVPVPAVANIAQDYALPLQLSSIRGEFITPTGAAFVAAVRTSSTIPKTMTIMRTGMGAGKRTYDVPSILRAMIISEEASEDEASSDAASSDAIIKIETNIDDCTGENLGFVMEELFSAGARDVSYTPCYMKKNRPAWTVNVICTESTCQAMEHILFTQTTTIGMRKFRAERSILERNVTEIQTEWGTARVKCVQLGDTKRYYPEYESVAELARNTRMPFYDIYNGIVQAAHAHGASS
ncbi:MAG: nickel pincer cofactor biosynthesis protein LarC [Treponema sp.]|nr:nickel pincer cofactor biosynthesis protein LarC [Treponema sp.]